MLKLRCFTLVSILLLATTGANANSFSTDTDSGSSASYYRSYHAHKDAVVSGAYIYGAPWAWAYQGEGYSNPYHVYPASQVDTADLPPPTRRLLKTQEGQCYELQRNAKGEELRTEISADNCNW